MRVEIEADLVIALREDVIAEAGSQLIIIEGEIVGIIPPRRSRAKQGAAEFLGFAPLAEAVPEVAKVAPPVVAKAMPEPKPEPESEPEDWGGGRKITDLDVLAALRRRPSTVRKLTSAFETRGLTGSVKNTMKRLRTAGLVTPTSNTRFPEYALTDEAKAPPPTPSSRPVRLITSQMILDALDEPKALSVVSIARALDIDQKTGDWNRLIGTTGSMVKHGDLKKVEVNGVMLLGLPEYHQAS